MELLYSPRIRAERLIAGGRIVLASSSLLAVWLDPSEPTKYATIAYSLLVAYVVYSLLIALFAWRPQAPGDTHGLVTHAFDLTFFSLFIYFTSGPGSPFFTYYVFSLVCATLRWQWRGTLWTAAAALGAFLGAGYYFGEVLEDPAFELNRFIIRGVYLLVVAVLLAYLGVHEQQTRREMAVLASWPQALPQGRDALVRSLLEHASATLGAPRALLVWLEPEEPWLEVAGWSAGALERRREPPSAYDHLVAAPLAGAAFLSAAARATAPDVLLRRLGRLERWRGAPIDAELAKRWEIGPVLSLPLAGDTFQGRLFLLGKRAMTSDDLVLGEIVAGVVAARLDHYYLIARLREAAATEERIRLARDLHDGVLQSFTGFGLRLAAVRRQLADDPTAARQRLAELQDLIALEQRDLRFLIQELKPPLPGEASSQLSLGARLVELVRRLEQEWDLHVTFRGEGLDEELPEQLGRDVYHLAREALVNAARHGQASAARLEIDHRDHRLAITVSDDGRGFPFHGSYDHVALAALGAGPRTLLERVQALHGSLALDSRASGSRIDITLPAARAVALAGS